MKTSHAKNYTSIANTPFASLQSKSVISVVSRVKQYSKRLNKTPRTSGATPNKALACCSFGAIPIILRLLGIKGKTLIELNYKAAVLLEDALIDLVYNTGSQEGLAADDVKAYVRYLANARLTQLGLDPIYPTQKNPLPWLDWVISGDSLKNFFEGTVTDYNASGLVGELDWSLITQGSDLGTEGL